MKKWCLIVFQVVFLFSFSLVGKNPNPKSTLKTAHKKQKRSTCKSPEPSKLKKTMHQNHEEPEEEDFDDILDEEDGSWVTTDISEKLVTWYMGEKKKSLSDDQRKKLLAVVAPLLTASFGTLSALGGTGSYLLWKYGGTPGKIIATLGAIGTTIASGETVVIFGYTVLHYRKWRARDDDDEKYDDEYDDDWDDDDDEEEDEEA